MRRLHCLLVLSALGSSADLKLSGWVSCSEWSCSKPIQEGIARLNFIGVKTTEDIDWLVIRSGETIVVTGKDAGTYKGQLGDITAYLKSCLVLTSYRFWSFLSLQANNYYVATSNRNQNAGLDSFRIR